MKVKKELTKTSKGKNVKSEKGEQIFWKKKKEKQVNRFLKVKSSEREKIKMWRGEKVKW